VFQTSALEVEEILDDSSTLFAPAPVFVPVEPVDVEPVDVEPRSPRRRRMLVMFAAIAVLLVVIVAFAPSSGDDSPPVNRRYVKTEVRRTSGRPRLFAPRRRRSPRAPRPPPPPRPPRPQAHR